MASAHTSKETLSIAQSHSKARRSHSLLTFGFKCQPAFGTVPFRMPAQNSGELQLHFGLLEDREGRHRGKGKLATDPDMLLCHAHT